MKEKTVGIIGGMGPEATVDLMMRVIRATPALDDADHVRMVVDNNPKVPSRIKAIIDGTGESPGPCMANMADRLARWGVDFIAIPCNTAHYYYDEVKAAVDIPVLNIIDLAADAVLTENKDIRVVGLLASTAVIMTEQYLQRFEEHGVELIWPSDSQQARLMASIKKIKTGEHGREVETVLQSAGTELTDRGAQALIIACTELSVIAGNLNAGPKVYDASQVLAETIVRRAKAL